MDDVKKRDEARVAEERQGYVRAYNDVHNLRAMASQLGYDDDDAVALARLIAPWPYTLAEAARKITGWFADGLTLDDIHEILDGVLTEDAVKSAA